MVRFDWLGVSEPYQRQEDARKELDPHSDWLVFLSAHFQARRALSDRQKDLEVKTQQLEIRLSNKTEEDIKKARRKSTQAGQRSLDSITVDSVEQWLVEGFNVKHTVSPISCSHEKKKFLLSCLRSCSSSVTASVSRNN